MADTKPFPTIPPDAPPEIKRKAEECSDLYGILHDIWQEYWDCYESEETIPCAELEEAMREAKTAYEARCQGSSSKECAELMDDWYDAWIEHNRVCVERPYSEKCANIYYDKYWPANVAYEKCLEVLHGMLNTWRNLGPRAPLPTVPQGYPTSAFGRLPSTTQTQSSILADCPMGQFRAYPGGPCRGAVSTGGLPGLPFESANVSPGVMSPYGGGATSFANMGRRIPVLNLMRPRLR